VSVDTLKTEVMREALHAGAAMINDINALRSEGAIEAVAASDAAVCLMHMQGEPRTMQAAPVYADVVEEVRDALMARVQAVEAAGIAPSRILLDPGFGFGKTLEHNVALFRALPSFSERYPVLVGVSRKSMIGGITGQPVESRVVGSAVAAALAVRAGASWVHDVAETRDALAVLAALGCA
jgi:dihydropteroate synthase